MRGFFCSPCRAAPITCSAALVATKDTLGLRLVAMPSTKPFQVGVPPLPVKRKQQGRPRRCTSVVRLKTSSVMLEKHSRPQSNHGPATNRGRRPTLWISPGAGKPVSSSSKDFPQRFLVDVAPVVACLRQCGIFASDSAANGAPVVSRRVVHNAGRRAFVAIS